MQLLQGGVPAAGRVSYAYGAGDVARDGQLVELERVISQREFDAMAATQASPEHHVVRQRRVAFVWRGSFYEIKTNLAPCPGLSILYCQTPARPLPRAHSRGSQAGAGDAGTDAKMEAAGDLGGTETGTIGGEGVARVCGGIEVPAFLEVVRDVTAESHLYMFTLARKDRPSCGPELLVGPTPESERPESEMRD